MNEWGLLLPDIPTTRRPSRQFSGDFHPRQKLSDADREKMIREYLDGEKVHTLAARYGVDPSYPRVAAIKKHGKVARRDYWLNRVRLGRSRKSKAQKDLRL